jgi:oxygen-independent coproporphyrinogen-3 oxidase
MPLPNWAEPVAADRQTYDPAAVFAAGERHHHITNTAYPIAHNRTWGPYRRKRAEQRALAAASYADIDDLCLYAHIPFCEKRCFYCEYTVVDRGENGATRAYMDRLGAELALYADLFGSHRKTLHGFDIGGGTPSYVAPELIQRLVWQVWETFRIAPGTTISIKTTPRIAAAAPETLEAFRQVGIGRISMGIQVTQPDLLRALNRDGNEIRHNLEATENIRAAGFERFNVDLMYGFAGQSDASWQATLAHAIGLAPEYITLYRMRYKLTRISHQAAQVALAQVRAQEALARQMLAVAGYRANPGKNTFSRIEGDPGTSDYLTRRVVAGMPYLGIGLGAQSLTETTISYNDGAAGKALAPYFESVDGGRLPLQDLYHLPLAHLMAKMICVSFYFGEVHMPSFQRKFGTTLAAAFPAEVAFAREQGLMQEAGETLRMTEAGARQFAGLCALFHAPSVKAYLLELAADRAGATAGVAGGRKEGAQ